MKRLTVVLCVALTLGLLLLLTACGHKLTAPDSLTVDDDLKLTWTTVESARFYTIEIRNVDSGETVNSNSRLNSKELNELGVGDYEIRVMATGGADNKLTSAWSRTLAFHRDYESGCVYELYNGNSEYRILRAGSAKGDVLIEGTYRGKPVTAIADNAFKGNPSIVNVVIGENLRTVGENAFYNCPKLNSVSLPESLTSLGKSAFQGCRALTEINLPSGLTSVPELCFAYCRALTSVTIGDHVRTIGKSAFSGAALTSVVIPDSTTTIGDSAFAEMDALTEVTIGRGVKTIGNYAFSTNEQLASVTFAEKSALDSIGYFCFRDNKLLTEIVLPEGLTDIGSQCFIGCVALASVSIPDSVTHIGGAAFNNTKVYTTSPSDFVYAGRWLVAVKNLDAYQKIDTTHIVNGTVGISDYCFSQAKALESVTLPASLQTVGRYAFQRCSELAEFKSGTSLRYIQGGAFAACAKLYKLNLTEGLLDIDDYAFYGCEMLDNNSLRSIVPKSVQRIGINAFKNTRLWSKPDENNIIYAGTWVVGYKEGASLGAATLSESVTGIADYAFLDCDTLVNLVNLNQCRYIGEGAFYNCSKLESVVLHNRVTKLPDYVFYKCTSLYNINVPTYLEQIGRAAFYKCASLGGTLDFSGTLAFRSVGANAFYQCTNLRNVNFGENLTDLGTYAFYNCTSLQGVLIPDTVRDIPNFAFAFCPALETMTIGSGVERIGDYAFYKCQGLTELRLPDALKVIGNNAFYKCTGIRVLELGESLETIGDYAFLGLDQVTDMTLPATLTSIGKHAFKGLASLRTLIIPKSVCDIRINAFFGCRNVTFFVEEGTDMSGWNIRWNSSNRPAVIGVSLSDDGDYVASVTVGAGTLKNVRNLVDTITPIASPERAGYDFGGWERQDGSLIGTEDLSSEPEGSKLTAVWNPRT